MPTCARIVPLSELTVHGLCPVRQHPPADLELTWQAAQADGDVAVMVALAGRPEAPAALLERALTRSELAVLEALAARAEVGWQFQLRVLGRCRTARAARAALQASGWYPAVVDDVFGQLLTDEQRARPLSSQDQELVEWLWENAYPLALTSQQCLWLLQQHPERVVGDDERLAGFIRRLDGRDVETVLRMAVKAPDVLPLLVTYAVQMDEQARAWALAWAKEQGKTVVMDALLRRFTTSPQPGVPAVPSSAVVDERRLVGSERRRVALNWAWLVRTGDEQQVRAVEQYVARRLRDVDGFFRGEDEEEALAPTLLEVTGDDYAALLWLAGRLRKTDLLWMLGSVDDRVLSCAPEGVHVPAKRPGMADLRALGADDFVLRHWPKVAPSNVVAQDGWDAVSRPTLKTLMEDLRWYEDVDVQLVRDVLAQDPPDAVVGLVPALMFEELQAQPRIVRYLAERITPGNEETVVAIVQALEDEVSLAQAVRAARAVLAPGR